MQIKVFAAVAILVVLLLLSLWVYFNMPQTVKPAPMPPVSNAVTFPDPNAPLPPQPPPPVVLPSYVSNPLELLGICKLNCNDPKILQGAQSYYNTKGMWKGVYTMTPTIGNAVGDSQCDIRYDYTPVGGKASTGSDKRRFTYQKYGSFCDWDVTAMGEYMSGVTV